MAFYQRGKPKKRKGSSVRVTGLFKTKRRGLFVGSAEELDPIKDVIRAAAKGEEGLVFFLWRNEEQEEGQPAYTLYMDVSQAQDSRPKRRVIEDDPEEDDETAEEPAPKKKGKKVDDDDEVPF